MNEAYRSCKRFMCGHARKRHGSSATGGATRVPENNGPCSMCQCGNFHEGYTRGAAHEWRDKNS